MQVISGSNFGVQIGPKPSNIVVSLVPPPALAGTFPTLYCGAVNRTSTTNMYCSVPRGVGAGYSVVVRPRWQSLPAATAHPPCVVPPSPGLGCGPHRQLDRRHLLLRPPGHPDQRFHGWRHAAAALGASCADRRGQPVAARPRGRRRECDDHRHQLWRLEPEPHCRLVSVRPVCVDKPARRWPHARVLGRGRALPRRLGQPQQNCLVDGHGHHGHRSAGHRRARRRRLNRSAGA